MLDRSKPPRVSQVEIVMIEGCWWWRYPAGIAPKIDQPANREDELRGMRKRKEVDARVQRRRRGGKTDMTASGGWWSGGHVVHEEFDDDQGDAELTVDEIGGELEGAESAHPRQPREVTLMEMVRPSKVKISKLKRQQVELNSRDEEEWVLDLDLEANVAPSDVYLESDSEGTWDEGEWELVECVSNTGRDRRKLFSEVVRGHKPA